MISKLDIRNLIESSKIEYSMSKDKSMIIKAAILKGLYLALDGKKGIAIPSKYDNIVMYAKIIFRYKIRVGKNNRAYGELYNSLLRLDKMPGYYLGDNVILSNREMAELLANLVLSDYNNDLVINQDKIYQLAIDILGEMEK